MGREAIQTRFANKLIVAPMSTATKASTAATSADTDIASAKCPITTYEEFGKLYSAETAGKTWPAINKIDNWVRDILPAVGAPMSVRKLRDCYKRVLSRLDCLPLLFGCLVPRVGLLRIWVIRRA